MTEPLLPDELWRIVEALIPPEKARPKGGRRPIPARNALIGILYVLRTGIPWEYLPRAVADCSGMTCWRRLHAWQEAGVWQAIHRAMLDRLGKANEIDWSRACVDSASVRAQKGAMRPAPIRPIAARRVASATSSSMPGASPSSSFSPRPIFTIAAN
jgi:transposase